MQSLSNKLIAADLVDENAQISSSNVEEPRVAKKSSLGDAFPNARACHPRSERSVEEYIENERVMRLTQVITLTELVPNRLD